MCTKITKVTNKDHIGFFVVFVFIVHIVACLSETARVIRSTHVDAI
jgi:hypothetical protein